MNDNSHFKAALDEVFESELDDYMKSVNADVICELSEKNCKKIKKHIKRREKPYYALVSTGTRRAVCAAAAVILLSASTISVKAVREAIHDLSTRDFSDHTEVAADNDPGEQYPLTIENEYCIEALPDSFELADHYSGPAMVQYFYQRGEEYISLDQFTKDSYNVYFDNEHTERYIIEEDGQEYLVFESAQSCTFVWDNGTYILQISSSLDKDAVLKLCRSTKIK